MGHIRLLRFMPMIAGRVILFPLSVTISAQYDHDIELHQFEGNMGKSRIGMTVARRGNTIEGGHYFYQKFLQDIPIAGSVTDSHITLTEPGGGAFHLRFVDNGSEGSQSLDFENSVGMDGNWTSAGGSRTYSVSLRGATILSVRMRDADTAKLRARVIRRSSGMCSRSGMPLCVEIGPLQLSSSAILCASIFPTTAERAIKAQPLSSQLGIIFLPRR